MERGGHGGISPVFSAYLLHRPSVRCLSALLALAACGEGGVDRLRPTSQPPAGAGTPGETIDPATVYPDPEPPWLSLPPGSRYFERDGVQAPVLMRNISAPTVEAFTPLFRAAREAGTSVVRLQLSQGFGYQTLGMNYEGGVLSSWVVSWDAVLDEAEREGLAVIAVFTLWGDWNSGIPGLGWSHYDVNPLSSARGGPAASPADLFADTEAQRAWLGWLSHLVRRWSSRPNVIAWEIFSELDLATGATESGAVQFVERAHAVVREIEPWRPAFASTSDLLLISGQPWQALLDSPGNDIATVHPYAADLDRVAVDRIANVRSLTNKPVLVGESGLDAAEPNGATLTSAPTAGKGLGYAIWAELTSGAASARALYWEDGYAVYYPATGLPLVTLHHGLEREAAEWLAGKDFRDFVPASVSGEPSLFGTALQDATHLYGWVRNGELSPPEWSALPLEGARVDVYLPLELRDAAWSVTLTSRESGTVSEVEGRSTGGVLSFEVAGPFESMLFDAQRGEEVPPICPLPADGCTGPIYALVLNGVSLFADPECPSARVGMSLMQCRNTSKYMSLSSCPSDGVTAPRSCVELYASDIEGAGTGTGSYYDAAGTVFDVVISETEINLDDTSREKIRTGVMRGTLTPSGGDGSTQPFELTFSACSQPLTVCLI